MISDAMRAAVTERTRLCFIANPNNPTGTWVGSDALAGFLTSLPKHVLVLIDEAYYEYVDEPGYPNGVAWVERFPNLIVTRTFSKIHGLAGLRLGYGVSHPEVAGLFNRVRQPFNVNSLALAAAEAALGDEGHVARSRRVNQAGLRQLEDTCDALGLSYIPSIANFLCIALPRPGSDVYAALLLRGGHHAAHRRLRSARAPAGDGRDRGRERPLRRGPDPGPGGPDGTEMKGEWPVQRR